MGIDRSEIFDSLGPEHPAVEAAEDSKIVLAILEMARERHAEGASRAEALAESANHALDLIRKARNARRAAASDPERLRDDDGFRRD